MASSHPEVSVDYIPCLKFTALAWTKLQYYIKLVHTEISGFGRVRQEGRDFVCYDVFILNQSVSGTTTELDSEAVGRLLDELMKDYPDEMETIKLWWHSHVDMSCFWSGTDNENMKGITTSYMFGLVGVRKGEVKVRLDQKIPFEVTIDDIPVIIEYENLELKTQIEEEIREKVSSGFHSTHKTPRGGEGSKRSGVVTFTKPQAPESDAKSAPPTPEASLVVEETLDPSTPVEAFLDSGSTEGTGAGIQPDTALVQAGDQELVDPSHLKTGESSDGALPDIDGVRSGTGSDSQAERNAPDSAPPSSSAAAEPGEAASSVGVTEGNAPQEEGGSNTEVEAELSGEQQFRTTIHNARISFTVLDKDRKEVFVYTLDDGRAFVQGGRHRVVKIERPWIGGGQAHLHFEKVDGREYDSLPNWLKKEKVPTLNKREWAKDG